MDRTDRESEKQYLQETLQIVERNLENYGGEVARMQAEIDEMLEHYHDNDVELWTLLNNTITLNDHMKRAMERNQRARSKPYFGRIIFQDETLGREESLYIGKGGISVDNRSWVVVDWRAPVANAYYENGLGKCSYAAPGGKEIPIDLKLKRTYEIEEGRLLDYYDTEIIANDELLMKYLSKNKEAVLGEIVATIQKEQNEIIRKSPYHNVIVQGVAGSGKTTVAMHRISFILYNYQERFRPEDFYIVGSNRILLNYITGVLPDLDVYGVKQMTMEQLFIRLLYEDWDEKKYRVRPVSGQPPFAKGTEQWFLDLEAFIRRLEWTVIRRESVYLDPRQFVEGLVDGKNGIYDKREEDKRAGIPSMPVLLVDGAAVERYITGNPTVSIQSKINMLNERLIIKIKDEFLGKGVKYTEEEKKAILRAYRGYYGPNLWKKSIYALYRDFLSEQRERGISEAPPADAFDVYDLAALALLYKWVKETEVISEAHHVVIDEAQDFGMMAYRVLHACIKDCTYTVMGDVSQNIHFGYGLGDWEALRRLLLPDPMDSFGLLKKSYRNTVEISDFATDILRHGSFPIYPVEPIIRHGKPVTVEERRDFSEERLAARAAEICRLWQSHGYDTVAVVCRDTVSARRTAELLARHIEILESDLEKLDFGSGIMVLPVEYTKGLEFDTVLIWDPTRENYPVDDGDARLLYVAATRALHELHVLCRGSLTGLIAEPVPDTAGRFPGAGNPAADNLIADNLTADRRFPDSADIEGKNALATGSTPVTGNVPVAGNERRRVKAASRISITVPAQEVSGPREAKQPIAAPAQEVFGPRKAKPIAASAQEASRLCGAESIAAPAQETSGPRKARPIAASAQEASRLCGAESIAVPAQETSRPRKVRPIAASAQEASGPRKAKSITAPAQEMSGPRGTKNGSTQTGQGASPRTPSQRFGISADTSLPVLTGINSIFGDMPATEKLRCPGHAKINLGVRWASAQADGLYLQSQYGTLRISPVSGNILRMTFSRGSRITDELHPLIAVNRTEKGWRYRDSTRVAELSTGELTVRVDKATGAVSYLDGRGKLLLAERKTESRQLEEEKNWLFLDWQKGEQLFARAPEGMDILKLRGSAFYISDGKELPFLLSDRGYGILPASSGKVVCCDVPAYGSYLSMEGDRKQDYYFLAGKQQNILNAYQYLCGTL